MAFQNLPPDLTLPPGSRLGAGSGTVYIGAANLPAGLNTGAYKSAIIWYTDAIGAALGIDYFFLAFTSDNLPEAGVRFGFYPTGGPTTVPLYAGFDVNNSMESILEAPDAVIVKTSKTTGNIFIGDAVAHTNQLSLQCAGVMFIGSLTNPSTQIQMMANGNIFISPSNANRVSFVQNLASAFVLTEGIDIVNLGVVPAIKARSSATIDTAWFTDSSVQTIQGIAGCTVKFAWRKTIDWVVEVRVFVQAPANFTPGTFLQMNCPANFPVIDIDPLVTQGPHITGVAVGSTSVAVGGRIDPGSPSPLYIFIGSLPANCTIFEISGMFTQAKP